MCSSIQQVASVRVGDLLLLGGRNDGRRLGDLLAEDVALDEVRQPNEQFVRDEFLGGDRKDLWRIPLAWDVREYARSDVSLRSSSSRVSCLVSRTKQNIMNQASRLSPE